MEEQVFDVGQAFNDFWAAYGSMIVSFLTSGAFGAIVVGIVKGIVGRLGSKIVTNAKTAQLTDDQIGAIAMKVGAILSGSALDIDLSKVVSETTREELENVVRALAELKKAVTNANTSTALMTKGMSRSALLTDEEKAELTAAAESLEYVNTEKQHLRITVEPTGKGTEKTSVTDSPTEGIVNFGG